MMVSEDPAPLVKHVSELSAPPSMAARRRQTAQLTGEVLSLDYMENGSIIHQRYNVSMKNVRPPANRPPLNTNLHHGRIVEGRLCAADDWP